MLSMRLHTASIGLEPKMIIATGGGSANKSITKIMSDVFGAPVMASTQTDSASLGAALRAMHGWQCEGEGGPEPDCFKPYSEVTQGCPAMEYTTVAEPSADAHAVYTEML